MMIFKFTRVYETADPSEVSYFIADSFLEVADHINDPLIGEIRIKALATSEESWIDHGFNSLTDIRESDSIEE